MVTAIKDLPKTNNQTNRNEFNGQPLVRRFTLEEFEEMTRLFPDDRLELINGEIVMTPPPDFIQMEESMSIETLLGLHLSDILKLGCRVVGTSVWYAVPIELQQAWVKEDSK